MLQAQGLQPLDPYRTLQVLPHAPRDLIDEAYYALAARANSSAAVYARLRDLNDAYALLTDEHRRDRYDAENGFTRASPLDTRRPQTRKPLLPGRRRANRAYAERYYDILAVDADATPQVIEIAHRILSRKYARARGANPDVIAAIDEAYRTLGNPILRANYDANLPPRPANNAPAITLPASRPVANDPAPDVAASTPVANAATPDAPVPAHLANVTAEQTDTTPPPNVERGPGGEVHTATPAADVPPLHLMERGPGDEVSPKRRLFILRSGETSRTSAEPASDTTPAPREFAPVRALRALLRRRELARQAAADSVAELSEEARARLVELRDGKDAPDGAPSLPPELLASAQVRALGEVIFLAGPYAGRSFAISDGSLILGDLDPLVPEYGRVSPYGGECMLRQAPGIEASVNGEPLAMPIAFLDDRDEVAVGPHRFRFDRTAEAEPIPIDSLQSS